MGDLPAQATAEFGIGRATSEEVFREHYKSVYRLALSLSGNHADAEDIAQEAFVAIIRALPRFSRRIETQHLDLPDHAACWHQMARQAQYC